MKQASLESIGEICSPLATLALSDGIVFTSVAKVLAKTFSRAGAQGSEEAYPS
jgi:hypothetical protein